MGLMGCMSPQQIAVIERLQAHKQANGSYGPSTRGAGQSVSFQVVAIWTYGYAVDELGEGMTGRLEIIGHEVNALAVGAVLGVSHDEKV